ncbi:MAG: TonB-dependent receptor [Proteobacteria bacterium]|nr:TonB-dependent receptor [Pseudomonadota bacterium]
MSHFTITSGISPVSLLEEKHAKRLLALAACTVLAGTGVSVPTAVLAEDLRKTEVEEITVTAQKREEKLQEAPLSISAFSATTLEEIGAAEVIDIAHMTPNLGMHTNAGGNSGMTVSIRGLITSDPAVTLEPTVGVYLDGVYVAKSAGSLFSVADLERIEVLRGPQGSLYGRNTVGGAINLITRKPSGDWGFRNKLSLGSEEYLKNTASLDFPLVDNASAGTVNGRTTFSFETRDGFFDNPGPGSSELDNLDRWAGNTSLRWEPSNDRWTLDYNFDFHHSTEEPTAFQLSALRPGSPLDLLNQFGDPGAGIPAGIITPFINPDRSDSTSNNRVTSFNGFDSPLIHDADVRGHGLVASYDLGDVTIKSITGLRSFETTENQDLDGTPLSFAEFALEIEQDQLSQELQAIGSAMDDRLQYVAGLYYFEEDGSADNRQIFFGGVNDFISDVSFDNYSVAPYGQATYQVNNSVSVTAGGRYTYEKKKLDRNYDCVAVSDGLGGVIPCDFLDFSSSAEDDWDNFSPMVDVKWQATDKLMTYARVARGFKSGGFNGRATSQATFEAGYDPEEVTSYELGVKSELLDNRLVINAAAFLSDYDNKQVTVFRADPLQGAVTTLENAAKAEITGAEIEVVALPMAGLDLRLGVGLIDPEYDEFTEIVVDPGTGVETEVDVSDDRAFIQTPDVTVTASSSYTFAPTSYGTWSARIDAYWQDEVVFLGKDNEYNAQGQYALVNARLQLSDVATPDGTLTLALWARNLFDKEYRNYGIDFGDAFGISGNTYGDPRTIGVETAWEWGG